MDGGARTSISASLNDVLLKLEANHHQHVKSQLGLRRDPEAGQLKGANVVTVTPSESFLVRIFRHLFGRDTQRSIAQREATSILHHQTFMVLYDEDSSIDVKRKIVALAEKKLLPYLSRKERQQILKNKDVILCGATERSELRVARKSLKTSLPLLPAKIPQLTLEDCRRALQDYFTIVLVAPELIPPNDPAIRVLRQIEQHFIDTRQPDGFQDLLDEVISDRLNMLRQKLPVEEYQGWLGRVGADHDPLRDKTLKRALRRVTRNALTERDSIHGHPRERVSDHQLELLQTFNSNFALQRKFHLPNAIIGRVGTRLNSDLNDMARDLGRMHERLEGLNLQEIREKLDNLKTIPPELIREALQNPLLPDDEKNKLRLTPEDRRVIAECRKTLLDIQLKAGRRWDMSVLLNAGNWSPAHKERSQDLARLLEVDALRGPEIDEAQMEWMLSQHDQIVYPLSVVVEGAGPTGLLTALTQFIAGANVTCFEQRSTQYDRVQVVRLDPLWMNMLKFYLGDEYYQLFGGVSEGVHEGKGIVRDDGFGEIVTFRLEEALHDRLQKVISYSSAHPPAGGRPKRQFELVAAHKLTRVEAPNGPDGKYKLVAEYNPRHDRARPEAPDYQAPLVEPIEADVLVCAGGKNSHLRNQEMGNVKVSTAKPYGVCSWELEECHVDYDEARIDFKSFDDFRGMAAFNDEFHDHLAGQLNQNLDLAAPDITNAELDVINNFRASGRRRSPLGKLQRATQGVAMQTRCFENKGLIYIGMEIPPAFDDYIKQLDKQLRRLPLPRNDAVTGDPLTPDQLQKQQDERDRRIKKIVQHFQIGWFQAVAHSYGLDQEGRKNVRCTPESVNRKFASVFNVQQDRVQQNVVVKTTRGNDHELMVTAAGDAAASPHFMRYSGLTGARENILNLQHHIREVGRRDPENRPQVIDQLRQNLKRQSRDVARFVRERGDVFLGKAPYWRR